MTLEAWLIAYTLLGLVTAAVVIHYARDVDWVTGSDSEVLFVGLPAFAVWPVVWGVVIVVSVVGAFTTLRKKLQSSE